MSKCWFCNIGRIEYQKAADLQRRLMELRHQERIDDILLLLEHPPTITLGRFAGRQNVLAENAELEARGIALCSSDRGGDATVHCPGQLVLYPIMSLRNRGGRLREFLKDLEEVALRILAGYGIAAERWSEHPGIWVEGRQIAAIGLRISRSITMHGLSLNVNPDMGIFDAINLCGLPGKKATSISMELGHPVEMKDVMNAAVEAFAGVFKTELEQISCEQVMGDTRDVSTAAIAQPENCGEGEPHRQRQPVWLKQLIPPAGAIAPVGSLLRDLHLNTVCESARCPNIGRCFTSGTATFLILGKSCTRNCTFCAVEKAVPLLPEADEPERIVEAVRRLGLGYVVITSVTRDDLADGGAGHFARTIELLHRDLPRVGVEVLIPDFNGDPGALSMVVNSQPQVLAHNLETVPRLYPEVRPQANYRRSLDLLGKVKQFDSTLLTKSGIMLGLGETAAEVRQVLDDLRRENCDLLTLGQYLAPSRRHHDLVSYVTPAEFDEYGTMALEMGFRGVASAPLVRSSYRAGELFHTVLTETPIKTDNQF